VHRHKPPSYVRRRTIEQARSQLVFAVGIDSRRDDNLVTGDAANGVAPPVDLGVYIFDDYTSATMLGFHGHP
jgi:hypothetical protein